MSLYRQLLYFFKEVENEVVHNVKITDDMLSKWQERLSELLNNGVVSFSQHQINTFFSNILKRNLTVSSYRKNFKIRKLDFNKAQLSARSGDFLKEHVLLSANLIRMKRDEQIQATLRRFSGWVSSIPTMGEGKPAQSIKALSSDLLKPLKSLSFENRRVLIDQGHKFTAAVNNSIARDQGAIAVKWVSHWKETGYNYRLDHKKRDGHIFLLKNNPFVRNGYVRKTNVQYIEDVDGFGQLPFCRCYGVYLFSLRDLPIDMLTEKGKKYING